MITWEHRSWYEGPSAALGSLAAEGEAGAAAYRTDTYLRTGEAGVSAKLREGRFEVKTRGEVREGLERWTKERFAFPICADAHPVLSDAPPAALAGPEALGGWAAGRGLAVPVRKHRRAFVLCGAECEATAVLTGGRAFETLGIEAADFAAARAAAARLGVLGTANASYAAWLATGDPDAPPPLASG